MPSTTAARNDSQQPENNEIQVCVILIIKENDSHMLFEYEEGFVKKLGQFKKRYGLYWNKTECYWQFDTKHQEDIKNMLINMNIKFIIDDCRIDKIRIPCAMIVHKGPASFIYFNPPNNSLDDLLTCKYPSESLGVKYIPNCRPQYNCVKLNRKYRTYITDDESLKILERLILLSKSQYLIDDRNIKHRNVKLEQY